MTGSWRRLFGYAMRLRNRASGGADVRVGQLSNMSLAETPRGSTPAVWCVLHSVTSSVTSLVRSVSLLCCVCVVTGLQTREDVRNAVSADMSTVQTLPEVFKLSKWQEKKERMVLEGKSGVGHNDYGSIGGGGGGETSGGNGMNQSDLYQKQPLLSGAANWPNGASPQATTNFYRDADEEKEDDDEDLKRIEIVNGAIRIEMPGPHREEPRFPKEKWKTFIAFLILTANFILTTTSLALVHERVPDKNKYPPLPDIVLDNIPTVPWALDISEVIIMISTNITFLVIVLHRHRFIVFRRVFLMVAALYMMRSVTMYVTVLPMSSTTYYCSPKANTTSVVIIAKRVFQLISGFGLSINGKHTYCGDFIYSGHTVVLVMCSLIINEYSPKRCILLHYGSWAASLIGIILVLVARGHYTVDVLIAYYVTTRFFWMYHTLANHQYLKQGTSRNCLSRLWWFRLFCYFEGNVEGPVPRQYNWPLPWPRRLLAKHPNRDS